MLQTQLKKLQSICIAKIEVKQSMKVEAQLSKLGEKLKLLLQFIVAKHNKLVISHNEVI